LPHVFSRVKEHLCGKRFESEDDINTAVIASLKRPTKDEYRAAITLSRGHMCKHSGISIIFLSSILLLK
jgi:hypothetical protein